MFINTVICKRCLSQSFRHQSTSCAKIHIKAAFCWIFRLFPVQPYCGMLQHKFYLPVSNKEEKIALQAMSVYFCCTLCATAVVSMLLHLANFSPCDLPIFVLAPHFMLIACWKRIFFEYSWVILRKEQRKRNFQAKEVSKHRGKKLFFELFCALNQTFFFAVPAWHCWETCKEKGSLLLIKKN